MENLNPLLLFLMKLRREIDKGRGMASALKTLLQQEDEWTRVVRDWMLRRETSPGAWTPPRGLSSHRRACLNLLERGLRGEPVLEVLSHLEAETLEACRHELDLKVAKLPFELMVPLLLFLLPSLLILLFMPFLSLFSGLFS